MQRITLDTNILPLEDFKVRVANPEKYEFYVVSVTTRETAGTRFAPKEGEVREIFETAVWGEGVWGKALWGADEDSVRLERILYLISNGAFPKIRERLTKGEKHQLRDAIIFAAHIRDSHDIFVTDDKVFLSTKVRTQLEAEFNTKILSGTEFIEYSKEAAGNL